MSFHWLPLWLLVLPAVASAASPLTFRNDVQAILSRAGCNMGACHGNLNGKGGFKLSLRGEDADADFAALTRGMLGRRTDPHSPADSLLLKKATGQVPHEGGVRFSAVSFEYQVLHQWIAAGCRPDPTDVPRPISLHPSVKSLVLVDPQKSAAISVKATFSDGTTRDVTALCTYDLTSIGVANIANGQLVREQFGETVLIVRYLHLQVPIRVAFLPDRPVVKRTDLPMTHPIDKWVQADLARLRIRPSELSNDTVFVRRAYLDACGIIPTASEVRAFLADTSPDKRAKLIDSLLSRPEFADYWAQKWGDLLRNEEKSLDKKGVTVFHRWIRDWLSADKPLTDFTREILTARGSTYATPAANFYRAVRDPYLRAESVAQVFLGLRVSCARCHNHPFDVWTQDDYHRFAAVFARIDYRIVDNKRNDDLDKHEFIGEQIVVTKGDGELALPRGGVAVPKVLGAAAAVPLGRGDRLGALADWLTAADNPFFAAAQANRIWAHLLGRGIVDPIDDFKLTNPPSNPELLDHLATQFAAGGYKLKPLVRHIMTSQTYQLSATPNDTN
nr:PSD1 and planctomycete cytochrome C domain-containing protein [Fimbriiglobus sp.]